MSVRTVAIVGASADRRKFGNKAVRAYLRQGWKVYPVNPNRDEIEGIRVLRHDRNRGYGAALKTGIRAARGEVIVITDADGTYPVNRIPELVAAMEECDMVVGARTGQQHGGMRHVLAAETLRHDRNAEPVTFGQLRMYYGGGVVAGVLAGEAMAHAFGLDTRDIHLQHLWSEKKEYRSINHSWVYPSLHLDIDVVRCHLPNRFYTVDPGHLPCHTF